MSKSYFLLLLTVGSLAAAASLQSGGARSGKPPVSVKYEARAGVDSLQHDLGAIRDRSQHIPGEIRTFVDDMRSRLHYIAADVRVDADRIARYWSTLIRTS